MKKLFNQVFVFVFFVLPFLFTYAKGLDYYRETVVEPAVGMKCGDGKPNVTWYAGEEIHTPTYDCYNKEHYVAYAKWFASKVPEVLAENEGVIDGTIDYFKEIVKVMVPVMKDTSKFFITKIEKLSEDETNN